MLGKCERQEEKLRQPEDTCFSPSVSEMRLRFRGKAAVGTVLCANTSLSQVTCGIRRHT